MGSEMYKSVYDKRVDCLEINEGNYGETSCLCTIYAQDEIDVNLLLHLPSQPADRTTNGSGMSFFSFFHTTLQIPHPTPYRLHPRESQTFRSFSSYCFALGKILHRYCPSHNLFRLLRISQPLLS